MSQSDVKKQERPAKKQNQWLDVWRRFRKNRAAMIGLILMVLILLVVLSANLYLNEEMIYQSVGKRLSGPSREHWFGCDAMGRDVFARVIYGGRYSIGIGIVATAIPLFFGSLLGAACGYYGGRFDSVIMRIVDIFNCIPHMLMLLAIVAALGASTFNLILALVISSLPGSVRLVRSVVMGVANSESVEAARVYGSSDLQIIIKHVMPNAIGFIIVSGANSMSNTILSAAGLSFMGMGVQPPEPEWGVILNDARAYMRIAPHIMLFSGFAIVLTALAINLMGDGLRDALDPKLKD